MRKFLLRVKIPLWIVPYVMSAILVHYSYCRLCKPTFKSKRERPIPHRASCVHSPSPHPTLTPTSNPCVECRFADPLCNIVNASRSNRFYYLLLESLVLARVRPSYAHSYAEASVADPGSGAFWTSGPRIRNRFFSGSRMSDWIPDPKPIFFTA